MSEPPAPERRVESRQARARQARTSLGRASVATLGFLVMLAISVAGYEGTASGAGAAVQPAPTAIAFVPLHPEILVERASQAAYSLPAAPQARMVAPPAPADVKGDRDPEVAFGSCSLPCIDPESDPATELDAGSSPDADPPSDDEGERAEEEEEEVEWSTPTDSATPDGEITVSLDGDSVGIAIDVDEGSGEVTE